MFKIDGNVDVTVIEAYVAESKFEAKQNETNNRNEYVEVDYDVCLLLQDKNGNTDTWHGEISNRTGSGTKAHMYRYDLTLETLREIGFNVNSVAELEAQFVPAPDGTAVIPNLVNMQATATVAKSEKTNSNGNPYYNIKYLNQLGGGNGGGKKLTMAELMAKRGHAAQAQAPAVATNGNYQPQAAPAPQQYQQGAPQQYQQSTPQQYQQQMPQQQPAIPAAPSAPAMPGAGNPGLPGMQGSQNCPY